MTNEPSPLSSGATAAEAFSFPSHGAKVRCDGRVWTLQIDNETLVLEINENATKEYGSTRSSRTETKNRRPIRIPVAEILAVSFVESKAVLTRSCSSCCSSRGGADDDYDDNRDLLGSDASLASQTSRGQRRKDSDASSSRKVSVDRESDSVVVSFIRRRRVHLWRLGRLVFNFKLNEEGKKSDGIQIEALVRARTFVDSLRRQVSAYSRPRRLLVFINPFGGKRQALKLYKKLAAPLFELCGIATAIVVTERANHARDYVSENDVSSYDGIVITGGDGLFNEVLNGLVARKQREFNVDMNNRKAELVKPNIAIGLISAGSTNALAHTVHGTDDIVTSALHIAIGDRRGIDVCGVYDGEHLLRFASTAVSYGFLGDVLKTSERLRRFGPPRYIIAAIKVWLKNCHYNGTVRYKTPFGLTDDGSASNMNLKPCRSICDLCADDDAAAGVGEGNAINSQVQPAAAVGNDKDTTWAITDDFAHVVGVVTSCICKLAPDGISPNCHLGDGYMHVVVVSRVGRFENLAVIGKIMSKNTDHTRAPKFRLFVVKEFSFTPKSIAKPTTTTGESDGTQPSNPETKTSQAVKCGSWNMDGELMAQPKGVIYFKVHRQLITLFARGIEAPCSPSQSG